MKIDKKALEKCIKYLEDKGWGITDSFPVGAKRELAHAIKIYLKEVREEEGDDDIVKWCFGESY